MVSAHIRRFLTMMTMTSRLIHRRMIRLLRLTTINITSEEFFTIEIVYKNKNVGECEFHEAD